MWREIWTLPSGDLARAARDSERRVAQVRLLVLCALVVVPITQVLTADAVGEILVGSVGLGCALLFALLMRRATEEGAPRRGLGFAASLGDVTLVSLGLVGILAVSGPLAAVNNKVLFACYFLVLASTGLRFDPRICVAAGLLAMLQYSVLVGYAAHYWDPSRVDAAALRDGLLKPSAQLGRVVILGMASALTSVIVVRARRLALLSTRDGLTGLLNRRFLDERMREACSRWTREPQPVALVIFDVDRFKEFNDRHGHVAGDLALRTVAHLLRECFRSSDTVARYGGEEFAVLMEGVTRESVEKSCERFRDVLATTPVPIRDAGVLTVSAGVALAPEDGREPGELVHCADQRLYDAKEGGRNQVRFPPPGAVAVSA